MNLIECNFYVFTIFCFIKFVYCVQNEPNEESKIISTKEDFIKKFTSLLNEGGINFDKTTSRDETLNADYSASVNRQFENLQNIQNSPNIPSNDGNLYPNIQYPQIAQLPFPYPKPQQSLPFPITSQRPFPFSMYQPPFGSFSQSSVIAALSSISRYDDLRCVPRLLCEITANRKSISYDESQPATSFISKDVLITLLTVLNFVDDSPVLLFARAALLGYSSKGDTRSCLTAYPTCPKDPEQLVNYLNNHNGGFFRFFNQQLYQQSQYAPQYQNFVEKYSGNFKSQNYAKNDKNKTEFDYYSPRNYKYEIKRRILNNPINIEEEFKNEDNLIFSNRYKNAKKVVFQNEESVNTPSDDRDNLKFISYNRLAKGFSFPDGKSEKYLKAHIMIFPDRTGTGNLVLNSDASGTGNFKVSFASNEFPNRESTVKFLRDEKLYSKMKFPTEE